MRSAQPNQSRPASATRIKLITPANSFGEHYREAVRLDPCCWCGGPGGTIEHIVPRSKRGPNKHTNLAGACACCNNARAANSLLHWLLKRTGEAA